MGFWELFVIAIGLSMDAFAIAICKGLSVEKIEKKYLINVGLWFGGAQAVMPVIGYLLGSSFRELIESVDHWFSFVMLSVIGINMIKEAFSETKMLDSAFSARVMFPLAIADSIDALIVGVTFAFLKVNIIPAILLIGITTFVLSAIGLWVGNKFGEKYKSKAELAGGIILIGMGVLILLDHLEILA